MVRSHLNIILFVVLSTLICVDCTSMKPMEKGLSRQQMLEKINPGDKVSIFTKNAGKHLITVEEINDERIVGNGKEFKFDDIVEIRQQKFNIAKTTGATLGVTSIVIIALVMLVVIAAGG